MQEQYQGVSKEIKILQQQEHELQEESLNVRLAIEQIDATITKHNSKIKYWQEEVNDKACLWEFKRSSDFLRLGSAIRKDIQ